MQEVGRKLLHAFSAFATSLWFSNAGAGAVAEERKLSGNRNAGNTSFRFRSNRLIPAYILPIRPSRFLKPGRSAYPTISHNASIAVAEKASAPLFMLFEPSVDYAFFHIHA
jgi:hypothetical protein